jgi:two-component system OmpR family sensor kinase
MMSRLPIRLRLTLAFAVAIAAVLAGMAALVYLRVGGALIASVDQTLHSQAKEAQARSDGDRRLVDPDNAGGTTLAEILTVNGRVRRSTPAGLPPLLNASDSTSVAAGRTVLRSIELRTPAGPWRILAVPAASGREAVVVARSLEPRHATLERLLRELLLGGSIALLLACGAGYALAAAALRPVEAMRRKASAVSALSSTRLPVPGSRDEIARLATTLNEMLERLEAAFAHERRFVADASHELRTPLALLRAELDLALRRPRSATELEQALRSAAEETERLSRLAEDLLFIARADQGAVPIRSEQVPVSEVLAAVADRFSARGRARTDRSGGRLRPRGRGRPRADRSSALGPRRQRAAPRGRRGRVVRARCR